MIHDDTTHNSIYTCPYHLAFNAFADNIYYSDPDRANLYLGGGAEPTTIQSIAYLLRNDILTNIEDMRAEVKFLLKELEKNGVDEAVNELDEIYGLNKMANEAMKKYLDFYNSSSTVDVSLLENDKPSSRPP